MRAPPTPLPPPPPLPRHQTWTAGVTDVQDVKLTEKRYSSYAKRETDAVAKTLSPAPLLLPPCPPTPSSPTPQKKKKRTTHEDPSNCQKDFHREESFVVLLGSSFCVNFFFLFFFFLGGGGGGWGWGWGGVGVEVTGLARESFFSFVCVLFFLSFFFLFFFFFEGWGVGQGVCGLPGWRDLHFVSISWRWGGGWGRGWGRARLARGGGGGGIFVSSFLCPFWRVGVAELAEAGCGWGWGELNVLATG